MSRKGFSAEAKKALLASEGWSHIPARCRPSQTVGRDTSRPILRHGYVRHGDEGVWLDCTDSYVLSRIPIDVPGDSAEIKREILPEGFIDVGSLQLLDKSRRGAFRVDENGLIEVEGYGALYARSSLGDFPDATKLIPANRDGEIAHYGINPALLARVADAIGCRHAAVRLDFIAPLRPVIVSSNYTGLNGAIGLVMPVRLAE